MKKKTIILIALIVVALCIAGYFIFRNRQSAKQITWETSKVARGSISNSFEATGTLEPVTQVEIGTQVSGIISKIYVDYNSVVKKGQLLAELDKENLMSELSTAQATLSSRQADFNYQKTNYERYKKLYEQQVVTQTEWEDAQLSYETAKQSVVSAQSSVKKAKTNLGYASIYSTIDGVVLSRAVEEGQTVAASFSTPTLFTIAEDLTKMRVIANVDEADIGGVQQGQHCTFTVDAFPDDVFDGTVAQIRLEAKTTSNVVTYEVVVTAPNPDLKLKPGLTATVKIFTMEKNDVLTVAAKAQRFNPNVEELKKVIEDPKEMPEIGEKPELGKDGKPTDPKKKLMWVKNGNKITPTPVTIGESNSISVEIVSGLNEGDEVVTGYKIGAPKESAASNTAERSPFAPGPRRNNTKK